MNKTTLNTISSPDVIIKKAHGNLYVKGWERDEVTLAAPPGELTYEEFDSGVSLSCRSDCTARVPQAAKVQIQTAYGAARVRQLTESLLIEDVHGQLEVRETGGIQVERTYGSLRARQIDGDLVAEHINGNVYGRSILGKCILGEVNGNVEIRDVIADVQINANGNVKLELRSLGGESYALDVDGNLHLRLPANADAQVTFHSDSDMIRIKLPDTSRTVQESTYELTLGSGGRQIALRAGGAIYFSASDEWETEEEGEEFTQLPDDFGDQIAEMIESQLEEQMEMMNRQLNEQFDRLSNSIGKKGLSDEEMETIMEQARMKSERANLRAQEAMRRAQEKMVRKMEAAQRRKSMRTREASRRGQTGRSWSINIPTPPTPPVDPVSEEERLMILRMLEQKKITLEEADELLSALEGSQE